jgi:hypothetical protein
MRRFFYLLCLLAFLLTAGCTSGDTSAAAVTAAPAPAASQVPTSVATPVPVTKEMAYLENVKCAIDQTTETAYHCNGKIRIKSGVYEEVQVIARYPDKNTFESGIVAMGGSNPVLKSFSLFPDLKYQDEDPVYFVRLDNTRYPVIMDNASGIAYLNPPPTQETVTTRPVDKTVEFAETTRKPTVTTTVRTTAVTNTTATQAWVPTVSKIDPTTVYPVDVMYFYITGWDFRQNPPPKVYLRKEGSSCEYCGIQAVQVNVQSVSSLQCVFDLSGETTGPASYDLLVTHSRLEDSYAILKNAVTIMEITPTPTEEATTITTP